MRVRFVLSMLSALVAVVGVRSTADAGCGCQKPPPPLETVRPHFAGPGAAVTFTHPSFVEGQTYRATFAVGNESGTADGVAVRQRDLADGQWKAQVVVPVPALPGGPATITVRTASTNAAVLTVSDWDFTVLTDALALPAARGAWTFDATRAAVSRSGVVYLALDLTGIEEPLIFEAQAIGYPLQFAAQDVVFYNNQGYLMQTLVGGTATSPVPIPGMFVKNTALPLLESDTLHYSRHEFATYFLQHEERQAHTVTPDGWHVDGTPHIDHNHLVIAIYGRTPLGFTPNPGMTPAFDLKVKAYSIFHAGLVGIEKVEVKDIARTDSYDATTMATGNHGDVTSNKEIVVKDSAAVIGDATAAKVTVEPRALVSGLTDLVPVLDAPTYMTVSVPAGLTSLGRIELKNAGLVIEGPGSFVVDKILLEEGATLVIDNTAGPVTLYVLNDVVVREGSEVTVVDPRAERFAVYLSGDKVVRLEGDGSLFAGVVYAPKSNVEIRGTADFSGAFVGKAVKVEQSARVHYDSTLRAAE